MAARPRRTTPTARTQNIGSVKLDMRPKPPGEEEVTQTDPNDPLAPAPGSATEVPTYHQPQPQPLTTGAIPITRLEQLIGSQAPQRPDSDVRTQMNEEEQREIDEIFDWWSNASQDDARKCIAKLQEYGSSDFDIMAQNALALSGGIWDGASAEDRLRVGREMSIAFYLSGKIARAFGAFQKGRIPSKDTIDDIVRYGMMWRRVRETGRWGA
jgi:hypothetical protein